jgi:hypothetical protein
MWKAQKPSASHITTAPATTAFYAYLWGFYVSLVILNENSPASHRTVRQEVTSDRLTSLVINRVAVEKLLLSKSTKIKSRQEALGSIFSGRLDIFHPPNFGQSG